MFKKTVPPVLKFGEMIVTDNPAVISAEMSSVSILGDLCVQRAERGKRKIFGRSSYNRNESSAEASSRM